MNSMEMFLLMLSSVIQSFLGENCSGCDIVKMGPHSIGCQCTILYVFCSM